MRFHHVPLMGLSLLAAGLACSPTTTSTDDTTSSSSSTGGGGTTSSSGGGGGSSGMGGSSSGSTTSGAGSSSSSTGGNSSSRMTCPLPAFDLCDDVTADGVARTITTSGTMGIDGLVTVGMTRAQVHAALGTAERFLPGNNGGASPFPFRAFHCDKRISVTYSDTPVDGTLSGTLSDDDVVNRIAVFEGFTGQTDTGIALGDPRSEVTTAYGTDSSAYAQGGLAAVGGAQDLYPGLGLAFTHEGGVVTAMAVYRPYSGSATPTPVNTALDIDSLTVGGVKAAIGTGTSFATVKQRFGQPDAEGFAQVGGQDIAILTYANLGLRFVALKGGDNIDSQSTLQAYITPPFSGVDPSNVIGLGASKAEWDAEQAYENQGDTTFEGVTLTKYKVSSTLLGTDILAGVSFVQDEMCTPRAALIILNFLEL